MGLGTTRPFFCDKNLLLSKINWTAVSDTVLMPELSGAINSLKVDQFFCISTDLFANELALSRSVF